jgi:hypothetical protein
MNAVNNPIRTINNILFLNMNPENFVNICGFDINSNGVEPL